MIRTSFNDGWTVRTRGSMFESMTGTEGTPVTLPHDALLSTARSADDGSPHLGYFHEGSWTYAKSIDVPTSWRGQRVTLEFEGAYRDAMIFVNGALAAHWANGYSGFTVPLDPYLAYGATNTIEVETQIRDDSRWYSGAGIYRPVSLLTSGLTHITPSGLRVATPEIDDEVAVVAATTEVVNESTTTVTIEASLDIHDSEGALVTSDPVRATLLAGERIPVRHRTYVRNPRRWSVESPHLYSASVRLSEGEHRLDTATTTFGIRTLSLDPVRGLRINGESIKLRGASLHLDNGVLGAAEYDHAAIRRIRRLKSAGFNAIRSAAKPTSRAILDACDAVGMLVIDESFDVWTRSKTTDDYSRLFDQWWERDIDALIAKAYNHPSVIMYTIGNEIIEVGTPHGARLGRQLAERVRSQDPSRFVMNAINGMMTLWIQPPGAADSEQGQEGLDAAADAGADMNDSFNGVLSQTFEAVMSLPVVGDRLVEAASDLDVVGYNYGDVRYERDQEAFPNRIVVGSETFPSRIAHLWELVNRNAHVLGDFTWVGWDYLGEPGVGRPVYPGDTVGFTAPYPWLTGYCADFDITGQRMPVSYYREIVFGQSAQPYLTVQNPTHRDHPVRPEAWTWSDVQATWNLDVPAGSHVTLEAYADADVVAFVVNGTEAARAKVGEELAYLATAEVTYEPGTVEVVAYTDGAETGRFALQTAGAVHTVSVETDRSSITADNQDIAFVEVSLVDADGTLHTNDDREVSITVSGPALLAGLGTGNPKSEESFHATTCTTYHGRALAVVRYDTAADDSTDPIVVTVVSDGIRSGTVKVAVDRQ